MGFSAVGVTATLSLGSVRTFDQLGAEKNGADFFIIKLVLAS